MKASKFTDTQKALILKQGEQGIPVAGAPQAKLYAVHLHEDLIQVPLPLSVLLHVSGILRCDVPADDWTNAIDPERYVFRANIDTTLIQQVFRFSAQEWKPELYHHIKLGDSARYFEEVKWPLVQIKWVSRGRVAW